ncbi:carbohydrate kinase [Pseudomonas sp. BAY1663]|nr:carbohydrate kinase [Pseudomonas sp. BAY1663]
MARPQALQGDAAQACAEARTCGVHIEPWRADAPLHGVLVDALLGTGISGEVREPYAGAIAAINESGLPVLAIDLPPASAPIPGGCWARPCVPSSA